MIEAVGFLGAVLGAWISLPQAIRAVRRGTAGVSPATFQILGAVGAMWLMYSVVRGYLPGIPGNFVQFVACGVVLFQCQRHSDLPVVRVVRLAVASLGLGVALLLTLGTTWFGWYVVVMTISLRLPQLKSAATAADLSGISTATWATAVCSNVLWSIYGVAHHDIVLVTCTALASASSLAILLIVGYRRGAYSSLAGSEAA